MAIPSAWPTGTYLEAVSAAGRAALLQMGVPKVFRRGEALVRESERSDHVILLLHGLVKATVTLENGRVALLNVKVGGDVVGEMAFLTGKPRSATVTACLDTRARVISAAQFTDYLTRDPAAHFDLDKMILRTLRWGEQRRMDFNGYPASVRLARVLVYLTDAYGHQGSDGIALKLNLTQGEIGSLVGVEEDTARREFRALRDRGVLTMGYRATTIVDRDVLRTIAEL
ncbi:Crp/Fnr family transcriptional regulator [Saccharothrix sp. S26]|uniref:Crp/Fnr family transcriptional regulator n=1 Tax=Saccharothrix sp. S26 TaxID=2907215 RepID=UPI001F29822E|nr:Crp/Fnr family transcriptional regulator [Saccharothrix sp. S26]MCE6994049.1 Crp/Fnr family transcriptional regulator [Saccharothrix sp. S26]